ncbi:hypothetical protein O181_003497 [Austropuccinia psidii MF-1]|uniref:Transmembrane protein n=1 Tax=Austropuccinia psidii MF-1 TaxID=1389203 RepID=A0A9Q3GEY5_9BASI|nr:hypothetical protein [Austropuccinia psidii MF-1]
MTQSKSKLKFSSEIDPKNLKNSNLIKSKSKSTSKSDQILNSNSNQFNLIDRFENIPTSPKKKLKIHHTPSNHLKFNQIKIQNLKKNNPINQNQIKMLKKSKSISFITLFKFSIKVLICYLILAYFHFCPNDPTQNPWVCRHLAQLHWSLEPHLIKFNQIYSKNLKSNQISNSFHWLDSNLLKPLIFHSKNRYHQKIHHHLIHSLNSFNQFWSIIKNSKLIQILKYHLKLHLNSLISNFFIPTQSKIKKSFKILSNQYQISKKFNLNFLKNHHQILNLNHKLLTSLKTFYKIYINPHLHKIIKKLNESSNSTSKNQNSHHQINLNQIKSSNLTQSQSQSNLNSNSSSTLIHQLELDNLNPQNHQSSNQNQNQKTHSNDHLDPNLITLDLQEVLDEIKLEANSENLQPSSTNNHQIHQIHKNTPQERQRLEKLANDGLINLKKLENDQLEFFINQINQKRNPNNLAKLNQFLKFDRLSKLNNESQKLLDKLNKYFQKNILIESKSPSEKLRETHLVISKSKEKFKLKLIEPFLNQIEDFIKLEFNLENQIIIDSWSPIDQFVNQIQSDLGHGLTWLDDVTYHDWQIYHKFRISLGNFKSKLQKLATGTELDHLDRIIKPNFFQEIQDLKTKIESVLTEFEKSIESLKLNHLQILNQQNIQPEINPQKDLKQTTDHHQTDPQITTTSDHNLGSPSINPSLNINSSNQLEHSKSNQTPQESNQINQDLNQKVHQVNSNDNDDQKLNHVEL